MELGAARVSGRARLLGGQGGPVMTDTAGPESGTLYRVPTPIGNYADLSPRALETLSAAGVIGAEDTRGPAKLLRHFGLSKRMLSFHEHNADRRAGQLLRLLREWTSVAVVSDAGTPLVSDPGFRLVRRAVAEGVEVVSLPGPCAATTALAASGLPTHAFVFLGFPSRTEGKRKRELERWRNFSGTLIFYEAPHRLLSTLDSLREVLGDRPAALGWNLTKSGERYFRGHLSELRAELGGWEYVSGEITLLVAGTEEGEREPAAHRPSVREVAVRDHPRPVPQGGVLPQAGLAPRQAGPSHRSHRGRAGRGRSPLPEVGHHDPRHPLDGGRLLLAGRLPLDVRAGCGARAPVHRRVPQDLPDLSARRQGARQSDRRRLHDPQVDVRQHHGATPRTAGGPHPGAEHDGADGARQPRRQGRLVLGLLGSPGHRGLAARLAAARQPPLSLDGLRLLLR